MPLTTDSDDLYYNSLITAGQIHGLMLCGLDPSCIVTLFILLPKQIFEIK